MLSTKTKEREYISDGCYNCSFLVQFRMFDDSPYTWFIDYCTNNITLYREKIIPKQYNKIPLYPLYNYMNQTRIKWIVLIYKMKWDINQLKLNMGK